MQPLAEQTLYINGRYVDSTSGETFDTANPATGEVICREQQATESDVGSAVVAARAGQRIWAAISSVERSRIMRQAVTLSRQRFDKLRDVIERCRRFP